MAEIPIVMSVDSIAKGGLSTLTFSLQTLKQLAAALVDLAERGDVASDRMRAFHGDISKLREATDGEYSDLQLVNTALTMQHMQLRLTGEQMQTVFKLAKRGADQGIMPLEAGVNSLARAMATGRTRALVPFGFDVEKINDATDKSAEIMRQAQERVESLGGGMDTAGDAIARASAKWQNWSDKMAQGFSETGVLSQAIDRLSTDLGGVEMSADDVGFAFANMAADAINALSSMYEAAARLKHRIQVLFGGEQRNSANMGRSLYRTPITRDAQGRIQLPGYQQSGAVRALHGETLVLPDLAIEGDTGAGIGGAEGGGGGGGRGRAPNDREERGLYAYGPGMESYQSPPEDDFTAHRRPDTWATNAEAQADAEEAARQRFNAATELSIEKDREHTRITRELAKERAAARMAEVDAAAGWVDGMSSALSSLGEVAGMSQGEMLWLNAFRAAGEAALEWARAAVPYEGAAHIPGAIALTATSVAEFARAAQLGAKHGGGGASSGGGAGVGGGSQAFASYAPQSSGWQGQQSVKIDVHIDGQSLHTKDEVARAVHDAMLYNVDSGRKLPARGVSSR